jgi:ABC-2 type transport system permease protein
MHNVFKVLKFELFSILNKKSVQVTTLIMCVVVILATSIPTVMEMFSGDESSDPDNEVGMNMDDLGFMSKSDLISIDSLTVYFGDDLNIYTDEKTLRDDVVNGVINNGYIIEDTQTIRSIVQNKGMYSSTDQMMISILQRIQRDKSFEELGIDPMVVDTLSNTPITLHEEVLGKDAQSSFLISYILMFAVYMLVIMYGSFVSTSVAREKDNRTMEILITSTQPSALIIGKVFANAIGGLAQFSIILAAGFIGYFINQGNYPEFISQMLFTGLSWDSITIFLIFTAIGYLLYLFLYASLGSLVSKVEDVGTSVTPITLLFMVAYIIASIGIQAPTNVFVKIGSFVPFTAILAMPIRYFLTSVPLIELLISMILMILTSLGLAFLSIKIYRLGSLSYGNKLGFIKALKLIFAKDNIDL